MRLKPLVTVVLLLFVAASVIYLAVRESNKEALSDELPAEAGAVTEGGELAASDPAPQVIAYYFHGTRRCATCLKIEALSDEALKTGFPKVLDNGQLVWRVINFEEPQNEHFVDEYKLYTQTLIIVELLEGKQARWKNLDRIWELVSDKEAFINYVQQEVQAYLGEA